MDFKRLCEVAEIKKSLPVDFTLVYDWASPVLYKYLLRHRWYGMTVNDARYWNNWALRHAVLIGHLDVCIWLWKTFALNADDARSVNNWALRWAVYDGHLDVCIWLWKTFALNADDARSVNNCALRDAVRNGHTHIVKWLGDTFGIYE